MHTIMYIIRDTYTNVSIYVPDVIAFICLKKTPKTKKLILRSTDVQTKKQEMKSYNCNSI